MPGFDWPIAPPVAYRGLHDAQKGIIENTPSAFAAAMAGRHGIECGLPITTDGSARLDAVSIANLGRIPFNRRDFRP